MRFPGIEHSGRRQSTGARRSDAVTAGHRGCGNPPATTEQGTLRPGLTKRGGANTFEDMKDAVITVRVPRARRARIEKLARAEGRSLSQQIERLIERAMDDSAGGAPLSDGRGARPVRRSLSGSLTGGRVPGLADFQEVRREISSAIARLGRAW